MRKRSANAERFINCGWASTRYHGRPAWRGPNGWVAYRHEGEWKLFRDCHGSSAYFASYNTVTALLKDSGLATRLDRTRTEIRTGGDKDWDRMGADGRPWSTALKRPAQALAWAHDDPRWGE